MKCLDCGHNIVPDEIDEHEGHDVVNGFFDEEGEEEDTKDKPGPSRIIDLNR